MEQFISTRMYGKLLFVFFLMTNLSRDAISQNIPDVNFANAIRTACPTCIDGANNLLPPAANLTSLDVSNKNISNLTGIGGFTGLQFLNCGQNQITTLPSLPISDYAEIKVRLMREPYLWGYKKMINELFRNTY